MTAEEYIDNLIIANKLVTPSQLEILKKLIVEGKTGVYTP